MDINTILQTYFGFKELRPKQKEVITIVLENTRHVLVMLPTGGGKSLCFQLPALMQDGFTVVISPLVALINDQTRQLQSKGIAVCSYVGTNTPEENNKTISTIISKKCKIIYCAPESLTTGSRLANTLATANIARFVFDEAHCILNWGQDFRPGYLSVCDWVNKTFPKVLKSAFTATANDRDLDGIKQKLQLLNHSTSVIRGSLVRDNLHIKLIEKNGKIKPIEEIINLLRTSPGSSIMYCLSKKDCEINATKLQEAGITAHYYHASMTNELKIRIQNEWMDNKIQIIVATIAFGMGIDKNDVRYVFHTNMPKSIDSYYQEIGRAGRDGAVSECITFFNYADKSKLHQMISNPNPTYYKQQVDELNKLYLYCRDLGTCRQVMIAKHFGSDESPCAVCDNCTNKEPLINTDITDGVIEILKAVISESASNRTISKTKVLNDLKSTFNSIDSVENILNHMIINGYLDESYKETSNGHSLTEISVNRRTVQFMDMKDRYFYQSRQVAKTKKTKIVSDVVLEAKEAAPSLLDILLIEKTTDEEPYCNTLLEELKAYRLERSKKDSILAYNIYSNQLLDALVYFRPKSVKTLGMIKGIAEKKIEDYGSETIDIIKKHCTGCKDCK